MVSLPGGGTGVDPPEAVYQTVYQTPRTPPLGKLPKGVVIHPAPQRKCPRGTHGKNAPAPFKKQNMSSFLWALTKETNLEKIANMLRAMLLN